MSPAADECGDLPKRALARFAACIAGLLRCLFQSVGIIQGYMVFFKLDALEVSFDEQLPFDHVHQPQ